MLLLWWDLPATGTIAKQAKKSKLKVMHWDDWLFMIMFFGVVPGLIWVLARRISRNTIWATFEDLPQDLKTSVDWKTATSLQLHDFRMKGFVSIASHQGSLLVKPGLIWRLIGLKCKSLKIASRNRIVTNGCVLVIVGAERYRLAILPKSALSEILRSGSEEAKGS